MRVWGAGGGLGRVLGGCRGERGRGGGRGSGGVVEGEDLEEGLGDL